MRSTIYVEGKAVTKRCSLTYIAKKFTIGVTLGEGAYAKVKLGTINETGERVAMKITNKVGGRHCIDFVVVS